MRYKIRQLHSMNDDGDDEKDEEEKNDVFKKWRIESINGWHSFRPQSM